jgi:SAM-dependent methyltransferase
VDYRKPHVFRDDWSPSRRTVYPQFEAERDLLARPDLVKILDFGCAAGWNMSRFAQRGRSPVGFDVVFDRVRLARTFGPTFVASGATIPAVGGAFDMVYVQHVLHHMDDVPGALREIRRVLRPGGTMLLIETIEDSPLIRWGRRLHPRWLGDEVKGFFTFTSLRSLVQQAGFRIIRAETFSVLFWTWEMFPNRYPPLERFTPLFAAGERLLQRRLGRFPAHCFVVAEA